MLMMQAVMLGAVRLPDSLRFTCAPDEGSVVLSMTADPF